MRLLVSTRSAGKMREIRRILARVPDLEVMDLDQAGIPWDAAEEGLEPHATFEENAASKARYFSARSGLATVADDSGIAVDALAGAPGVRTKRFAQDTDPSLGALEGQALDNANNRTLVERLQDVELSARTARYVCVAALVRPGHSDVPTFRGEAEGVIVDEARGTGGFGYDPHVLDPDLGRTFAEMTPDEKDARSHRGAAFRALATWLEES